MERTKPSPRSTRLFQCPAHCIIVSKKKRKLMSKRLKRRCNDTRKITSVIFAAALLVMLIPFATAATLTASPNNSNIINVNGSGFNQTSPVSLFLFNGTEAIYTFPEQITTDADGNFSAIVIVPTILHGTFNITANTTNFSAAALNRVFPNFTGQQGIEGPQGINGTIGGTGPTGPPGPQGEPGTPADNTFIYVSLAISLAAAVGVMLIAKKTGERIVVEGAIPEAPAPAPSGVSEDEQLVAEIMMERADKGDWKAIKWLEEHGYKKG